MFTMKTVYTLPKSRILLLLFVLTLTALTGAFSASAQTPQVGDYGSLNSGNWLTTTIWGRWNGTSYVTDGTYPGQNLIDPAPAVYINAVHNVTANFTTPTTILYNSLPAVTTPNPIGKLTISGTLTLSATTTYIKTLDVYVTPGSGTINFPNNTGLALLPNAVLYVSTGGLSGKSINATQSIYIGSLYYAIGQSNSAQYTFAELMESGGTINAIINQPANNPITICQGSSVSLQGSFSGTYGTVVNETPTTTNRGVTYRWYNGSSTTIPIYSSTISLPNMPTPSSPNEHIFTPIAAGTYTLTFRVETWFDGVMYYNEETRTVVVRPTPTATISGGTSVCQGTTAQNITFTNTQALPVTVTYNINNGTNSTIDVPAKLGTTNGTNNVTVPTTNAGTFTYNLVSVQYQTTPNCGPNLISGQSATVTVTPLTTITTQPVSKEVCPGTNNVSLSVATTGTGTLTYQWYSNSSASNTGGTLISGATSATYTTTNPLGTYYYYCVVKGTCNSINTNVATITVSNTATTWTGNTGTNWDVTGNWTCGIPTSTSNVTIPATTNKPVVNITTAVCNNLTIENVATLTIAPGMLLTVGGKITGAETLADAGKIRVKASPDGTGPNGSLIINCEANSTSVGTERTLNKIYGTVEFYTKGNKATTGVTWYDNIDGSPTKGTTFNANYQWQYFGVPVKEVVANPTFYGSFLRKYREDWNSTTTAKWEVLNNASELKAFEGYEITQAAAKRIDIVGELQFCDKTLTLTRLAPVAKDNIRFGLGQNIFGNSYTAAIKISKMENTDNKVERTVYLYNTGSLADWAAASLDVSPFNSPMIAGSYISIPWETSNVVWDDQIPSMQGFLLKYTTAETKITTDADAQVTLKYDGGGVAGNTRPQLAPKAEEEPLSYLRVNLQSASTVDNLWLFSREGTSSSFDNGWDGHKHFGTPTAFIYSMTPDGPMQVNTDRTIDGSVINFYANSDTDYTLTLVKSNLDEYSDLKLIDFGTKTVTPLTAEMTRYNFSSSNAGVVEKRFMIVNSASKIDFKKNDFSLLYGYLNADKTLIVTNFSGEPGTMTLSTASGVTVMNKPLTTGTSHFPTSLKAGAYVLTMQAGANQTSMKVLVNNK